MAPEYFLFKMQWWEVNRYLSGLHRRHRTQWETTRHLEWLLTCMFHDKKNGPPPKDPQAVYTFGWEKDAPVLTDEDADYLDQVCEEYRKQNQEKAAKREQ